MHWTNHIHSPESFASHQCAHHRKLLNFKHTNKGVQMKKWVYFIQVGLPVTHLQQNSTTGFSTHTQKNGFITHTWTTKLYNQGVPVSFQCVCAWPPPPPPPFFFFFLFLLPHFLHFLDCYIWVVCVCVLNLRIIFICVMFSCVLRNILFYMSLVMHICTYWHTVQHKSESMYWPSSSVCGKL